MKQKIGVWGLGIGGKSVTSYLHNQGYCLEVMDKKILTTEEYEFLQSKNITYIPQIELESFFERNSAIIPSQGIDLSPYCQYRHKFITELDLFYKASKKPIIAITGSVGKTSVVHLLSQVLAQYNKNYAVGGNIGVGMLDLITHEQATHGSLLELSSWQLEHCSEFAPELALWTNLYPNHLDRHGTFKNYFHAKYQLIKRQEISQKALVPFALKDMLLEQPEMLHKSLCFFSTVPLEPHELNSLRFQDSLYLADTTGMVIKYFHGKQEAILNLNLLPKLSYSANWLIIAAACDILGLSLEQLYTIKDINLPAHRFEQVACVNTLLFYNDSKATVPEATLAAVDRLKGRPILLFLGGLSKGIDREPFIKQLAKNIDHIFCFGAEADILYGACIKYGIKADCFATLEQAFSACMSVALPGHHILFSPSGASFDLFKDYQERGECFNRLVKNYVLTSTNCPSKNI